MIHLLFLIALYFLPAIVAGSRHLHERTAITMLNLFLGWTFIGWIIALIWAITAPSPWIAYVQPPYYPPRWR
jgi:hypothetical protein